MGILVYAIMLFGAWLVFAGTTAPATALLGGTVVTLATLLFRRSIRGAWLPGYSTPVPERFRPRRLIFALVFLPIFLWKVLVSGIGIARFALTPGVSFWPGIVKTSGGLPTIGSTTILANLITLTPGTLTMDYDPDQDMLYIHWMDVSEYEAHDVDEQVTSGMRPWIREISGW
jgi:multicomponent Na+:H+ antiporter subunit E